MPSPEGGTAPWQAVVEAALARPGGPEPQRQLPDVVPSSWA